MKQEEHQLLQWHPAFYADLQIELESERSSLILENEHQLGTKPMEIDVLILRKRCDLPIRKNIGRIFDRYNIIEYKSPDDYVSINDFYKVWAYACLYKSENNIIMEEMTITFACSRYPRKLFQYLRREKSYKVERADEGIYYVTGADISIQFILLHKLSRKNNLWLRSIGGKLSKREEAIELIQEYKKHKKDERYESVMDLIVRANKELFLEVKTMCQALEELMKDELEAMRKSGWEAGERHGWEAGEKYGWRAGEKQGKERGAREGISRFAKLSGILLRQNQQDQLLRASEDEQYREELFRKYEI